MSRLMNSKNSVNHRAMKFRIALKAAFSAVFIVFLASSAYGASVSASVKLSSPAGSTVKNAKPVKKAQKGLPIIDGREAVASVEGEPVTVGEFNRVLYQLHESLLASKKENGQTAKQIDYAGVLNRLINVHLADQEAKRIGLARFPAVKAQMAKFSDQVLAEMAIPGHFGKVEPNAAFERRVYKNLVKEYKLKSAVFKVKSFAMKTQKQIHTQKELDLQKRAADLLNNWARHVKTGEDFDRVVKEAMAKGIAIANLTGYYIKPGKLPVNVADIVAKMKVGQTSPLLAGGVDTYVLLKLIGVRYPKGNKLAMEQARQAALSLAEEGQRALFLDKVERKYITLRMGVFRWLHSINYTAKGFDIHKLEKDNRVLAYVKGGRPVTVAELAKKIDGHFYHGVNTAKESEVLNAENILLTEMLQERALKRLAISEGLQKSREYKDRVSDYDRTLLFGAFMQGVVAPQVKVSMTDLTAYYKKHINDYSAGEQMRIRSLVYKKVQDAQNAVSMLKSGDEFNWVKVNSPGQYPIGTPGLINFGDKLIYVDTLSAHVQKKLRGAKTGGVRLYEETAKGGKYFYVLYVEKEVPPAPKPFSEVKAGIYNKVYGSRFKKVADGWFEKLRKAYAVKIYDKTLKAAQPAAGKKQKT